MKSTKGIQLESFMRQRRNLAITIGLVVLSVGLTLLFTIPQSLSIKQLRDEINEEKELLSTLETKRTKLLEIEESNIFNQKDKIGEVLPSNKPIQELLINLDAISIEAQIAITEYISNPGAIASASAKRRAQVEEKKDDNIQSVKLETIIVGDLANIHKFFSLIEKISPLTSVSNLDLQYISSADTDLNNSLMTEATLTLDTYYFNKAVTTKTETPLPEIQEEEKNAINEILFFTPSYLKDKQTTIEGGNEDIFEIEKPVIEPAR